MPKIDDHGHKEKNKHYEEDYANYRHQMHPDDYDDVVTKHENNRHKYHLAMKKLYEQYRKQQQIIMKEFDAEEDAWASHFKRPEPDPHVHDDHHRPTGSAQVSTLDPKMVKSVTSNICKHLGIHVSQ
jgi:hypothetical protein